MKAITLGYSNRLFAEGLELMIQSFQDFKLLQSIPYEDLVDYYARRDNGSKILILELNIPKKSDLELIKSVLDARPDLLILLLSLTPSPQISFNLIESGISAYILKSCMSADLLSALDKITTGKNYFCSTITMKLISEKGDNGKHKTLSLLTEREKEILIMLVNNCSTGEVAGKLSISHNTVKTHKRNIQAKLGIHSMIGMLLYAVRNSLVEVGYHDLCNACPHYSCN